MNENGIRIKGGIKILWYDKASYDLVLKTWPGILKKRIKDRPLNTHIGNYGDAPPCLKLIEFELILALSKLLATCVVTKQDILT